MSDLVLPVEVFIERYIKPAFAQMNKEIDELMRRDMSDTPYEKLSCDCCLCGGDLHSVEYDEGMVCEWCGITK